MKDKEITMAQLCKISGSKHLAQSCFTEGWQAGEIQKCLKDYRLNYSTLTKKQSSTNIFKLVFQLKHIVKYCKIIWKPYISIVIPTIVVWEKIGMKIISSVVYKTIKFKH